jgi:hypothetical protein
MILGQGGGIDRLPIAEVFDRHIAFYLVDIFVDRSFENI